MDVSKLNVNGTQKDIYEVDNEPTIRSEKLVKSGGVFNDIIQSSVFDLSVHTGDSYATLQDALNTLNALPSDYKHGGMCIKYVDNDNKYVQYRLVADEWSINVEDWYKEDDAKIQQIVKLNSLICLEQGTYNLSESTLVVGEPLQLQSANNRLRTPIIRTKGFRFSVKAGYRIRTIVFVDKDGNYLSHQYVLLQNLNRTFDDWKYCTFIINNVVETKVISPDEDVIDSFYASEINRTIEDNLLPVSGSAIKAANQNLHNTIETVNNNIVELIGGQKNITSLFSFVNKKLIRSFNGEFTSSDLWSATEGFINVEGIRNLRITVPTSDNATESGLAFYSDNNDASYISGIATRIAGTKTYNTVVIPVPSTAKYMRTTWLPQSHEFYNKFSCIANCIGEHQMEISVLKSQINGATILELTGFGTTGEEGKAVNIGDIYYNTSSKLLRQLVRENVYNTVPFNCDYYHNNALNIFYKWNGSDMVETRDYPIESSGILNDTYIAKPIRYSESQEYLDKNNWKFKNIGPDGTIQPYSPKRVSQRINLNEVASIRNTNYNTYGYWIRFFDNTDTYIGSFSSSGIEVGTATGGAAKSLTCLMSDVFDALPTVSYAYVVLASETNIVIDDTANTILLVYGGYYSEEKTTVKIGTKQRLWLPVSKELQLEYGSLKTDGTMDTVSEASTFFTKKRTKNYIVIEPFSLTLTDCTANIYLYTSDFKLVNVIPYTSSFDAINYTPICSYFKIVVTISSDNAKVVISIPEYKEVKNEYISEEAISFTYQVTPSGGRDLSADDVLNETTEDYTSQFTTEKYYNSGMLRLPPNYRETGTPVKMVLWAHGSGWYSSINHKDFNPSYLPYIQYLQKEGYAIFDCYAMSSKYWHNRTITNALGSPTNMACIYTAYHWILEHYNIDNSGIYVSGKSLGGIICANMLFQNTIPVRACCPLAPELDARTIQLGYAEQARIDYCDDMGFVGAEVVIGTSQENPMTAEVYRTLLDNNVDKMCGYVALLSNVISHTVEELAHFSASNSIYDSVKRLCKVPVKIFIAPDDGAVSYSASRYFIKSIKAGGCVAELRTMPRNTGGHHAVDYGDDANNKPSIKVTVNTAIGYQCENVPLAWAEMVQFFRRF